MFRTTRTTLALLRQLVLGAAALTTIAATGSILLGCEDESQPETWVKRLDDPAKVAGDIWTAVARDADSVYAKGPERLFVLVQRLFPQLVDRSVANQMADTRIRAYLVSQGVWPTAPGAGLSRGRV